MTILLELMGKDLRRWQKGRVKNTSMGKEKCFIEEHKNDEEDENSGEEADTSDDD